MQTLVEEVVLGSWTARVERPCEPESLIDEARFADDEFLPYWAEPWPSGRALAGHVAGLPVPGLRVVEVGCGLGLPSLAAAAQGADVLATDWAPEAVDLLMRNAARNGVRLRAERLDWRDVDALVGRGPFDLLLAADVLYEERNAEPLAGLVGALACRALVADPGRRHAAAFLERIGAAGLRVEPLAAAELPHGAIYRIEPA